MQKVHVLVDLENNQPTLEDVKRLVPDMTHVWLFHSPGQAKRLASFAPLGERCTAVPISRPGKNALDFHLTFYVGYLAARNPGAKLVVVAIDRGYGPMVEHAVDLALQVAQVAFKPLAKPVRKAIAKKAPAGAVHAKGMPTMKGGAKKAPVKDLAAKTEPAKNVPAKNLSAKNVPVTKAPLEKAPVTKAPLEKAPVGKVSAAKVPAKAAATRGAAPKRAAPKSVAPMKVAAKSAVPRKTKAAVASAAPPKQPAATKQPAPAKRERARMTSSPAKGAAAVKSSSAQVVPKVAPAKVAAPAATTKPRAAGKPIGVANVVANLGKVAPGRRPKKLKQLRRHLSSLLGTDAADGKVSSLLANLLAADVVRLNGDTVVYAGGLSDAAGRTL